MAVISLKEQLFSSDRMIGTFIKTPNYQVVEIVTSCNLSFIALDAEHAPFSKSDLDTCILAARANDTPVIVRVPTSNEEDVLSVLDMGANGVLFPHINCKQDAIAAINASKYKSKDFEMGRRGFSNSSRSGNYGSFTIDEMIEASNKNVSVLCQIEEIQAVDNIDEITEVSGIDCLFIGRADLAVSMGCNNINDSSVENAIDIVVKSAKRNGIPLGMYLPDNNDLEKWIRKGFSLFIVGSDQSYLKSSILKL
ncbi:MAG: aldolase [Gammaproteobacteria bacterium]|nr:MAG: aldolase [Gammaproteobacteria bacterium]